MEVDRPKQWDGGIYDWNCLFFYIMGVKDKTSTRRRI